MSIAGTSVELAKKKLLAAAVPPAPHSIAAPRYNESHNCFT